VAKNLVIVESPAKAKTINKYLGKEFAVKASMGHVRDLPKNPKRKGKGIVGGVDTGRGFTVDYEVLPSKKKVLDELKAAAAKAEAIYLAADPDREGEAICWHLAEELVEATGKKKAAKGRRVHRVVFNEITRRAIEEAFQNPTEVDPKKVDAQQARRVLDRLVGYAVSPILWDKVRRGLSAGRVQSVALKLICDREREIRAFRPEEYWTVVAHLQAAQPPVFPANLLKRDGEGIEIANAEEASAVRADLEAAAFKVEKVTARERRRHPVPPFITSKLQQEAFRKLGFPVRKTMQLAQRLYEGVELGTEGAVGLITYMRTDSTRVSADALSAVRAKIAEAYGEEHVPEKPNFYKAKKDAQDAHEAIRPTYLDHDPEKVKRYLGKDELKLYTLIWNRFVASQMKPAAYDETVVEIAASAPGRPTYLLRARGSTLKFKGFLAVYEEAREEKVERKPSAEAATAEDQAEGDGSAQLPPLAEGEALLLKKLDTDQHFTEPPPRYSEASLVKALEENGIGRPSTYATIIATIEAREYTERREGRLYPTELGFVVTDLLVQHFQDIMNVEYTAAMEEELDEIEEGRDNFLNTLSQFWKKFKVDLDRAKKEMENVKGREEKTDEVCDKCGKPMVKKWGRYGNFLACSGYPDCKNTRQLAGEGAGEVEVHEDVTKAVCPKDGQPMILKKGRFGPFLACSRYPECRETRRLVRGEGGKLQVEVLAPIDEKCPECGSDLMWRRGRFGAFIACSNYPACKYVKKKEAREIGLVCPECGEGQVVERKGRWGRFFYGCRRYPECRFTAYHRPIPEPCPDCGRSYLLEKETKKEGKVVFCGNEACHFKRKAA
jgi:DNA topoisomerase-1